MKMTKLLAMLALVLPVTSHAGGWYAGLDVGSAQSEAKIDEYVFVDLRFGLSAAHIEAGVPASGLRHHRQHERQHRE